MPRFEVLMGRTTEEWATVVVEADDAEQAEARIEAILKDHSCGQAYCDLVNRASWTYVDGSTADERVVEVLEVQE